MDTKQTNEIRTALLITLQDKVKGSKTAKTRNRYATAHHHIYTARYGMALDMLPKTSSLRPAVEALKAAKLARLAAK